MMKKDTHRSSFLSAFNLYGSSKQTLLTQIEKQLKKPQGVFSIFTPNPEQVMLALQNPSFKQDLLASTVRIPDGIGLIYASRVLSGVDSTIQPLLERITGVDMVKALLHQAGELGKTCLVIGGKEYDGATLDTWMFREFSKKTDLSRLSKTEKAGTIWWLGGYTSVAQPTKTEKTLVRSAISTLKPDIVFVAFGAPAQEKWVVSYLNLLEKNNVAVVMVVGGAFDMLLGKVRRAPQILRKLGLEWFFRLIQEPWRWRRQLRLLEFTKHVLHEMYRLR